MVKSDFFPVSHPKGKVQPPVDNLTFKEASFFPSVGGYKCRKMVENGKNGAKLLFESLISSQFGFLKLRFFNIHI